MPEAELQALLEAREAVATPAGAPVNCSVKVSEEMALGGVGAWVGAARRYRLLKLRTSTINFRIADNRCKPVK